MTSCACTIANAEHIGGQRWCQLSSKWGVSLFSRSDLVLTERTPNQWLCFRALFDRLDGFVHLLVHLDGDAPSGMVFIAEAASVGNLAHTDHLSNVGCEPVFSSLLEYSPSFGVALSSGAAGALE